MREMKMTKIEGRIYLFPIPVVTERKYLIACSTEEEAHKISEAIRSKKISHPDLLSDHFLYLTHHTDRQTKIFVLAPNIDI